MRVPRSGSRQSGPQEEALEGVMKIDLTIWASSCALRLVNVKDYAKARLASQVCVKTNILVQIHLL